MAVLQGWDTAGYPAVSLGRSQARKAQGTGAPFLHVCIKPVSVALRHADSPGVRYFMRLQPTEHVQQVSLPMLSAGSCTQGWAACSHKGCHQCSQHRFILFFSSCSSPLSLSVSHHWHELCDRTSSVKLLVETDGKSVPPL